MWIKQCLIAVIQTVNTSEYRQVSTGSCSSTVPFRQLLWDNHEVIVTKHDRLGVSGQGNSLLSFDYVSLGWIVFLSLVGPLALLQGKANGLRFRESKVCLCGGIHQFNAHDLDLYLVIGTFGLYLDLRKGVLEVHGDTGVFIKSLGACVIRDH